MSQNKNSSSSVDQTLSIDDGDMNVNTIPDELIVVNNDGWANFDTFENNAKQNSEAIDRATSNTTEDDWANFESSAIRSDEQIRKDNDDFGDYSNVQDSSKSQLSLNSLSTEQIESLISTCFPLESPISLPDNTTPFELPSFTTNKKQIEQLPCFQYSLSLWATLANVSNDPLGIQYQWRKSNVERLFHQALGVQERFRIKTIPSNSDISQSEVSTTISENDENKSSLETLPPHFDWKKSGLENPLTDIDSPSLSMTHFDRIEDPVYDINKTLDLDYYVPPIQTLTFNKDSQLTSSTTVYRNDSPILQQRSTPIKTMNLFPGASTLLNENTKPVTDSSGPNYSFINPAALIFPT